MADYRSDIDMWTSMWDEAQKEGVHPTAEPPRPSEFSGSDSAQDAYYGYLDSEADLLHEEKISTPNPVYPDSAGPDHETTPPVWADEDIVKEVESLKNKLFDVENRLASQMGGGQKWQEKAHEPDQKKLIGEIDSLKKRIEKLSSTLGTEHEDSPWVVNRD